MQILVHIVLPISKQSIGAGLRQLSGRLDEFSVKLDAIPGGRAFQWATAQGYPNMKFRGASQALSSAIATDILDDAESRGIDVFYVAYNANTLAPIRKNIPQWPNEPTFESFLAKVGLEIEPVPA